MTIVSTSKNYYEDYYYYYDDDDEIIHVKHLSTTPMVNGQLMLATVIMPVKRH